MGIARPIAMVAYALLMLRLAVATFFVVLDVAVLLQSSGLLDPDDKTNNFRTRDEIINLSRQPIVPASLKPTLRLPAWPLRAALRQ